MQKALRPLTVFSPVFLQSGLASANRLFCVALAGQGLRS